MFVVLNSYMLQILAYWDFWWYIYLKKYWGVSSLLWPHLFGIMKRREFCLCYFQCFFCPNVWWPWKTS